MELPPALIEKRIVRGTILHSTAFNNISHGKFFLVIGISQDKVAGYFFVNSNVNKALFSKPQQLEMQYPVRRTDYDFLSYDSFVCATNISKIPVATLTHDIETGRTKVVTQLKEEHINEILEATRKSALFSDADKQSFFY